MIYHITRAGRHLIFWGLIGFAIMLTAIRLLLGSIEVYRTDLEAKLSAELVAPVKIASLGAGMRAFRPTLVLKKVQVLDPLHASTPAVLVNEIRVSIDLLELFKHQPVLTSAWVTLFGAQLTIKRHADGHIAVEGLPTRNDSPPLWLLQGERFEILHSQVSWLDAKLATAANHAPVAQVFKDVNILLKNTTDDKHLLNMLLQLPTQQGNALALSMQLRGNFLAANGLNGLIYVQGKQLALPSLIKDYLPQDLQLAKGKGDVELWSYWQDSQAQALTGKVQLQGVVLQRNGHADLQLKNTFCQFNAVYAKEQWQFKADHVIVNADNFQLLNAKLAAELNVAKDFALSKIALQIPALDLQQFQRIQEFFADSSVLPPIQGKLKNFSLQLEPKQQQFAIRGDVQQFAMTATDTYPGISNTDAHFAGSQQQGVIDLALQQTALNMPQVFPKALELQAMQTHMTWQQNAAGWLLSAPVITLNVPDMQVKSDLKLLIKRDTYATEIDLASVFSGDSDVRSFGQYFPTKLMGPDAEHWLGKAFVQGRAKFGGIILKGALADFPFNQNQGVFEIILNLDQVELDYAPGWGHVHNLSAEAVFYQAGMHITAQGNAQGVKLEQFVVDVPSFETSEDLIITGKGKGQLGAIFAFLQESQIKPKIDDLLGVISAQGAGSFDLDIKIPLIDHREQKINGSAMIENAKLDVLPLDLPVTALNGRLNFDAYGLTDATFKGQALGGAITGALSNTTEKMHLSLLGRTDVAHVQQQFKLPDLSFIDGASDYRLDLTFPGAKNQPVALKLSSELAGLELKLPDILAKQAADKSSFAMQMQISEASSLPVTFDYAQKLRGALKYNVKQKRVEALDVLVGEGEMPALPKIGRNLDIDLKNVALAEWIGLAAAEGTEEGNPLFEQISLHGRNLKWQRQDLGRIALSMQHKHDAWQIALDSALMKGQIIKPLRSQQEAPIKLALDYLNLSALSQGEPQAMPASQAAVTVIEPIKRLPLFNVSSKQVLWHGIDLGALELNTRRIHDGFSFPQFKLKNAKGELELTGNWHYASSLPRTQAAGTLTMQAFGDYLAKLDLTRDLKSTQAVIKYDLSWRGAPQDFALKNLDGSVDVQLENGRILSIEPGFGRILGFLAMEQWGRRLRLDFSDLYAEGLMFNSINGHFALHQGNARTNHLLIDAIPAEIIIRGTTNIAERTLNNHVMVLPKSSAAVPIAGTIVDKVLTFAAETVTGNSQAGFMLGSEFQLRGTWQNPEVTQLHENDGLLQKTWHGLSDFPWLR